MAPQAISKTLPCLVFTCNSGHGRGDSSCDPVTEEKTPRVLGVRH